MQRLPETSSLLYTPRVRFCQMNTWQFALRPASLACILQLALDESSKGNWCAHEGVTGRRRFRQTSKNQHLSRASDTKRECYWTRSSSRTYLCAMLV